MLEASISSRQQGEFIVATSHNLIQSLLFVHITTTYTMTTVQLQSQDHRDLLDIIDKLRSKGISKYVDLPELLVCGDQSVGKSSVLEAISGMSFPAKDNLCTRFATELVLRRDNESGVKVSITPGPDRPAAQRQGLLDFDYQLDAANPDLGTVVEEAAVVMGISDTKVFSTDTLRVEMRGPQQPHLTIVDLPGLFRAGNADQSVEDAKIVKSMVTSYMTRPRSIILAVVSAKSDFALQDVTELARKLDPKGMRTLGIITKPDTLDDGSESETKYIKLAQNKDVVFRLGWHVLKNRDYKMRNATSEERDKAEEEFFAKGNWKSMDASHVGIKSLRPRLSNVLKDQILRQLPSLLSDIESGITECKTRLARLGSPRTTLEEQRRYLLRVSQEFSSLMKAAVDGLYNQAFFGSAKTEEGYQTRVRAIVQNALSKFEEEMRTNGQNRILVEKDSDDDSSRKISRTKYLTEVRDLMRRSRGRELMGTFNPLIIGELFAEQCHPWKDITLDTKDAILKAVYDSTRAILSHIAADETADGIFHVISSGIDALKDDLDRKITELLEPHHNGHPITYNHYLTETVQKVQADRRKRNFEKVLRELLGDDAFDDDGSRHRISPSELLSLLEQQTDVDMELYASELAVDYMQAYYKVSTIPLWCE